MLEYKRQDEEEIEKLKNLKKTILNLKVLTFPKKKKLKDF